MNNPYARGNNSIPVYKRRQAYAENKTLNALRKALYSVQEAKRMLDEGAFKTHKPNIEANEVALKRLIDSCMKRSVDKRPTNQ